MSSQERSDVGAVAEAIRSNDRFLRAQLARELTLRVAPEVRFELDRGIEHAQRIDRVLRDLKEDSG